MKNIPLIFLLLIALALGLGAGYFLFEDGDSPEMEMEHDHAGEASAQIWTCSMHPQIRQSEPGLCPICEMELIPAENAASSDPLVLEMTPEAIKLARVETTTIGATDVAERSLTLSGKLQADEGRIANQVAHVPGRIEALFVTFTGERVRRGQRLATIYSPELITAQQELLEAKTLATVNPALLPAARQKLASWKIAPEQIQAIEESGHIQETFTIYADVSGVVSERRVAVGEYVRRGEVLFNLSQLDRLWVLFDAYESDLAELQLGDRIAFTTTAVPNQTFSTRIDFIDPVIDPATRVAKVRGAVDNRGGQLKPEMFVRGTLTAPPGPEARLLVPQSAVLWTGTRSVVYVQVPEAAVPSYEFREVGLGERIGESYIVTDGLAAGEEVVTHGNFVIDAAAQLNNQASMMNRQVALAGQERKAEVPDFTDSPLPDFHDGMPAVITAYLGLKDALVASEHATARQYASELLAALPKVPEGELRGEALAFWRERATALQNHGRQLADAAQLEDQRRQFDFLSRAMIQAVKAFGPPAGEYYVQHCPMAFDDAGADWLSASEEILNPYFGDAMLRCGLVEEVLAAEE